MEIGKEILNWNTSEVQRHEINYQMEERSDEIESGAITKEEIKNSVYENELIYESEWDYLTESLSELMKNKNKKSSGVYWKAKVENFGWNNRNGEKVFKADNGEQLLLQILPNTECIFKVHNYGSYGFAIQNHHHDSVTGNEWYYITPVTEKTYNQFHGIPMKRIKTGAKLKELAYLLENTTLSYNEHGKDRFKEIGIEAMYGIKQDLKFKECKIDYNRSGIASSGDLTLIGMFDDNTGIYISISQDCFGNKPSILYRGVKHIKDYSGGSNNFASTSDMQVKKNFYEILKKVANHVA